MYRQTSSLSLHATKLWAKTGSGEDGHLWMPLYIHMGDSSQVASFLWSWLSSSTRSFLADACNVSEDVARAIYMCLAGVHDIGKASPNFQGKVIDRSEALLQSGLHMSSLRKAYSHAFIGENALIDLLPERGWSHAAALSYAGVIGGHHGTNPNESDLKAIRHEAALDPNAVEGDDEWDGARRELVNWLLANLDPSRSLERTISDAVIPSLAQILLTGLVIMADWIASNADLFPLVEHVSSWDDFRTRASRAFEILHLPPHMTFGPVPENIFHQRFPSIPAEASMNSLQRQTLDVASQMDSPGIIVVEGPMGCGKTEAALMGAEVLANRFGLGGICYLLPTQATTNGMFGRVKSWLSSIAESTDEAQSMDLHLLHSKAALNEDFASLPSWHASWMGDERESGDHIIAHQWFSGRKRGLLAPLVVGTVDQLLMAALNTRHVHLRHLGLRDKVVIIDEVHAYDAYMNVYVNRALAFCGAYGIPVILLSATLPPSRRVRLIRAYQGKDSISRRRVRPLPSPPKDHGGLPAYPLLSASGADPDSAPLYRLCDADVRRIDVRFEFIADNDDQLIAILNDKLVDGGCVCILRNTVSRAQQTYRLLKNALDCDIVLTHSRFLAIDRALTDKRLVQLLGPDATNRPRSLVVVSTQVIEQSLDVDFDLMITDIAPIDLLLQRMGRLHRHARGHGECNRPQELRQPHCFIVGGLDDENGIPRFDEGTSAVYEPALLYRTTLALRTLESGIISLPADIAQLVERVYEGLDAIPAQWSDDFGTAQNTLDRHLKEKEERAKHWLLTKPPRTRKNLDGWMRQYVGLSSENEARAAVRDTQDSLEVMAVLHTDNGYEVIPWVAEHLGVDSHMGTGREVCDDETARAAALCTVNLPQQLCASYYIGKVIEQLEHSGDFQGWQESRWLRGMLVLVFDERGEAHIAVDKKDYTLSYTREEGLQLERLRTSELNDERR